MRAAFDTADIRRWSGLWPFAGYEPWLVRLAQVPLLRVEQLATILTTDVDFHVHAGRLAAGLDGTDVDGSYAACCVEKSVPTRPDNLHDLLNALTWARFPRAKHALCVRQVRQAQERGVVDGLRVRTREQDACAMLDEGGLILGPTQHAFFGHAALEDAVVGRDLRPFLVHVDSDDLDDGLTRLLTAAQPIPRVRERHAVMSAICTSPVIGAGDAQKRRRPTASTEATTADDLIDDSVDDDIDDDTP